MEVSLHGILAILGILRSDVSRNFSDVFIEQCMSESHNIAPVGDIVGIFTGNNLIIYPINSTMFTLC